jgi:hypothetical protein
MICYTIIAENYASKLTVSGCASFCPGTRNRQEQDEGDGNQHPLDQQEDGPRHIHRCSSWKRRAMVRVQRLTMVNEYLRPFSNYGQVQLVSIAILVRLETCVTLGTYCSCVGEAL